MIRLTRSDRLFPERLRAIFDPPKELYLRGAGEADLLGSRAVAVVGARSCSPYGAQVARMLGRELASAGIVVVSGLARGVDGEAHRGALEASGLTVAVLADAGKLAEAEVQVKAAEKAGFHVNPQLKVDLAKRKGS